MRGRIAKGACRNFWSGFGTGPTEEQTIQAAKAEAIEVAYMKWVQETSTDPKRTIADCEAKYAQLKGDKQ